MIKKFIHVSFGYPGSIHDARVLRLSGLFDLGENEQTLTSPMKMVSGTEIPPLIIGDRAYPLLKWLVKPYPNRGHLQPDECEFNKKLSAARSVVERAFGMFKGRWGLLLKRKLSSKPEHSVKLFLLHVFYITSVLIMVTVRLQRQRFRWQWLWGRLCTAGPSREGGTEIREALKNFVWDNL